MITPNDYRQLKKVSGHRVVLDAEYFLKSNNHGQIFLTRGGKKEYCLTDNYVRTYLVEWKYRGKINGSARKDTLEADQD